MPAPQRHRKLPRKILSWMITAVAIVCIALVAIRFQENPTGQRAAHKEEKEKKEIAGQRPGDPEKMKAALDKAAERAREEKAREDREKAKAGQLPTDVPPIEAIDADASADAKATKRPNWTNVPGASAAGDAIDRYEAAKTQVQKNLQPGQAQNTRLAAFEYDEAQDGRQGDETEPTTGNPQLDAMLKQLKAAQGRQDRAGGPDTTALQRLLLNQAQAAAGQKADQDRPAEEWLKKTSDREELPPAVARPPVSRYLIAAGEWIPCLLKWAISTRQPGEIGCQVMRDVYDTATNRILLIPQYSTLYGPYNSNLSPGQESILFAFQRLRYPGGATVLLGGMSGADQTGRFGVEANVNSHFLRIYGSSFLISGIAKLASRNDPAPSTNININAGSSVNGLSAAAGQVLVDTVKKIMERNTDIRPTADLNGAEPILVYVNRDLVLSPAITQTRAK